MALTGNTRFDARIVNGGSPQTTEVLMVLQVEETFETEDIQGVRWRNARATDLTAQIEEPMAIDPNADLPADFPEVSGFTKSV